MSSVYLIRHGQAGTRADYDTLSDLGQQQAYLLGQYFAAQKIPFKALVAGCLNRQQQTAVGILRAYREAGLPIPEVISDPDWSEFNMTAVFSEFAPLLCEADADFKREYQALMKTLEDQGSANHRAWTECDTQAMRAWMQGRFPCRTESWDAFSRRVLHCRNSLAAYEPGDAVAVFTSASPIAIWVASSLGVSDSLIMRIAGVMYNSAVTTLRLRNGDATLFTFNGVPHLNEPDLRTFR